MADIRYEEARVLLEERFAKMEELLLHRTQPEVDRNFAIASQTVFNSTTQAYREVILGCLIARIQDISVNIRLPYVIQGEHAYNGRTLDERVINPFLQEREVPCSRGPYLSVFRRQVRFDESTRSGLRDKNGYDAFLALISIIESTDDESGLLGLLDFILYSFVLLREEARVELTKLNRVSLPQCEVIIKGLLATRSGGRLPMLLSIAIFQTLNAVYNLNWQIEYQGINAADGASGAGGDVTIKHGPEAVMAIEVTERPVDRNRVIATFRNKIAPSGLKDYLFLVNIEVVSEDAKNQANNYFSQGHDVNFIDINTWIMTTLATIGSVGRETFFRNIIALLDNNDIPKSLKVAWNEQIAKITT